MKNLLDPTDLNGLERALAQNPALANEGIAFDAHNLTPAHPLHRICDGVFAGKYTDAEAVEMARLFLAHGADINGGPLVEQKDTPLIAAASLHADEVAILYLDQGANFTHAGTHGGTALHWAAWCGRDRVVSRLIGAGASVHQLCIDFKSTPLIWAVNGWKRGGSASLSGSLACVKLLIQAGADTHTPNVEGKTVFDLLTAEDAALKEMLG